jgi:hypothetical protein
MRTESSFCPVRVFPLATWGLGSRFADFMNSNGKPAMDWSVVRGWADKLESLLAGQQTAKALSSAALTSSSSSR